MVKKTRFKMRRWYRKACSSPDLYAEIFPLAGGLFHLLEAMVLITPFLLALRISLFTHQLV